jgi:histidinol-phosphatase
VLGETYYAARGSGAWRETASGSPERLHISDITEISRAVVCITDADALLSQPFILQLLPFLARCWTVRNTGGALDGMLVAGGRADVWLEPSAKPWDLAASKIIIEEAGGRFVNFDGGSSIYGGNCIACVPALEDEMLRFVRSGSRMAP